MGVPGQRAFGLYHPAQGDAPPSQALLICPPFGWEDVSAYRSLRALAQACATDGVAVLRLEYRGCGNAEGDAESIQNIEPWLDNIVEACRQLRHVSGARHVTLLGLRLGALLASLAAPRCGPDIDLIAFAPVVSGRAYLRELKAMHMAGQSGAQAARSPSAMPETGLFESGGFALSHAMCEALSAVDLTQQDAPPTAHITLIERDDLPQAAAGKWAARLTQQGASVTRLALPDYARLMADPHHSQTPPQLIPMVRAHLQALCARLMNTRPAAVTSSTSPDAAVPAQAEAILQAGADGAVPVKESPVFIGTSPHLFGMLSEPVHATAGIGKRLGVLMLNAGAVRLIGPNRMYVRSARHWAAQGHTVLRVDIAGLGDSPAREDQADNIVYSAHALDDVHTALQWLRARPGLDEVIVMGLCSGAYHAFKSAVRDMPVDELILINPLTFFWKEGMSLDPQKAGEVHVARDMMRHSRAVLSGDAWLKLARGGISLNRLQQIARQSVGWVGRKAYRRVVGRLGLRMKDDLPAELRRIASRGIRQHYVFANDDPGLELLSSYGGPMAERLKRQGMLSIARIAHADHTFTDAAPRAVLMRELDRIVAAIAQSPPARPVQPGTP